MGDDVENTKFLPFKEETPKKTEKGKYKMKFKIRAALASSILLAWLSWLTITSEVARANNLQERVSRTNKETIMERIIETKLEKLDNVLDTIRTLKEYKNSTSYRQMRSTLGADVVITTMVESGETLVKVMNVVKDVFLSPFQSAIDALEKEIKDIQNKIDGLTREQKELIPKALVKLYNVQHDLVITREALVSMAKTTMDRVKQLINIIAKIGPRTKKVGYRVKVMLKKFNKLLQRSEEALKGALSDYKVMVRDLNEVRGHLEHFGETITAEARGMEKNMNSWIADTRAAVYGGCAAAVLLGPGVIACYAIAAGILESKIKNYKDRINTLLEMAKKGGGKSIELAKKAQGDAKYIQEEIILITRWRGQVKTVFDEFEPVFSGEQTLLLYLEIGGGKKACIEMLCGLSQVCKNYMEHKYKYDGYKGLPQTPIPAQHKLCGTYKCATAEPGRTATPTTIGHLRLGDIGIVASIGDSLSAAAQYKDDNVDVWEEEDDGSDEVDTVSADLEEKKLVSFVTGGSPHLTTQTSLFNILQHFNPTLLGGSSGSNFPGMDQGPPAGLNFATTGASIRDSTMQAKKLVDHLRLNTPKMQDIWKLVTIQFGVEDLCSAPAYEEWSMYLRNTLSTLRTELPKTVVLLMTPMDVTSLLRTRCNPSRSSQNCPWIRDNQSCRLDVRKNRDALEAIISNTAAEFRTSTFGVEVLPTLKDFAVDTSSSDDCLHPDDHHNSMIGKNLWNNFVTRASERTSSYGDDLEIICPDANAPLPLTPPGQASQRDIPERSAVLTIKNYEASKDYVQIEFKNQDNNKCSSQELNSNNRFNKNVGEHKYKFSTVKDCYFSHEDQVQFRIVTQKQKGLSWHDQICINLVELDVMRVRFMSTARTCAEGQGEWQAMTSTSPTCG